MKCKLFEEKCYLVIFVSSELFKENNLYIFHATYITRSVRAQVRFCSCKLRVQRTYINIDAKIVDAERRVRSPLKPIVPPCLIERAVFWTIYCTAAAPVRHCCFGRPELRVGSTNALSSISFRARSRGPSLRTGGVSVHARICMIW